MTHTLNELLNWRYATKAFDTTKTLPKTDLEYILEAGRLTATSYGLQPFKIIVVTDETVKHTLMNHAYGQGQVGNNSALLILAAETSVNESFISEYATRIEQTRDLPLGAVDEYKGMMTGALMTLPADARRTWAQKQAYIALGTMMVAAAERGVDSCPMEGFIADEFDTTLGLKERNLTATVILPLGYRSSEDTTQQYTKVRRPVDDMVVRL